MMDKKHLAWILPAGVLAFLMLPSSESEQEPIEPSEGKEGYYLQFNKDQLFENLLATEEHFRNVDLTGVDRKGFLNCAIKHLASGSSHAREATSHSLIAEGEEASRKFRELGIKIRRLQHDLQRGNIAPEQGIRRVRELRHDFEEFNDEYDISQCEACTIRVETEGLG